MTNQERLNAAVALALADAKFMGDTSKVNKAIDALTPKSTVSGTLKRLQRNALSEFLVKKDKETVGYTEETKSDKIREYVHERFRSYMEAPKTSEEATRLYNAAYQSSSGTPAVEEASA